MFDLSRLSQTDPRWKNMLLGFDSESTLGNYGCLVTCMAMVATPPTSKTTWLPGTSPRRRSNLPLLGPVRHCDPANPRAHRCATPDLAGRGRVAGSARGR